MLPSKNAKGGVMEENLVKNMERAKFIKRTRQERAWSQTQLAMIADVNLRTVQRLEKDGTASFHTLQGIAQAFEIDVKELNPVSNTGVKGKSQKKVYFLTRLTSGKSLADVVVGADQFQFEHDEDHDPRSINAMKDILKLLKSDVVRLYDADPIERLNVEAELSQEIKGLEDCGYYLFGIKRVIPRIVGKQKTEIVMCTIFMSHSRSPKIICDKKSNMVIPALLTEVAR